MKHYRTVSLIELAIRIALIVRRNIYIAINDTIYQKDLWLFGKLVRGSERHTMHLRARQM